MRTRCNIAARGEVFDSRRYQPKSLGLDITKLVSNEHSNTLSLRMNDLDCKEVICRRHVVQHITEL